MLYLLSALAIVAVAASVGLWYYRGQAKAQKDRADTMQAAAKHNGEVAKQLGAELKAVLAEIKRTHEEEKERDEQEADQVVTAADASDFLNDSVRPHSGGPDDGPPAPVPAKRKPGRARFIYGFGRHQRTPAA